MADYFFWRQFNRNEIDGSALNFWLNAIEAEKLYRKSLAGLKNREKQLSELVRVRRVNRCSETEWLTDFE